jgi:hypothetical protein
MLGSEAANRHHCSGGVCLDWRSEYTIVHSRAQLCTAAMTNNVTVFLDWCMLRDLYMTMLMPFS